MCWSGEASIAITAVGFAGTGYAYYKKTSPLLWGPLFYFTLMELLQAYSYTVINQCSLPSNQIATLLGYLHICFQPFFANAVTLYLIPTELRKKIEGWVYSACFVASIITLIQLYPFDWAGNCDPARPLCGARLCSVTGNWHIAWEIPTNGIGNFFTALDIPGLRNGFVAYMVAVFGLPLLYGSWRFTIFHAALGPIAAALLTSNANERPAVWCLLSVGLLSVVVFSKVEALMRVQSWPLWPKKYRS